MRYAVFFLVFICYVASAQEELYPGRMTHLKGIKQCSEYSKILLHNQDKVPNLWAVHYPDADGNDTLIEYLFMGKVRDRVSFSYKDGLLTGYRNYGGEVYEDTTSRWDSNLLVSEQIFTYRDKKLVEKSATSYSDGAVIRSTRDFLTYGSDGRLSVHMQVTLPMTDVTSTYTDEKGNVHESSSDSMRSEYNYQDTVVTIRKYFHAMFNGTETKTFNRKGQLLSVVRKNTKGEVIQTLKYAYNTQGLLREGNYSKIKGMPTGGYTACTREIITYDNEGNVMEKKGYNGTTLMSIMTYKYTR
jgi:hypothetical protein